MRNTLRGPSEWFTGTALIDEIASAPPPSALRVSLVVFEPEARTAWHTHPLGQVLYAVEGLGLVQVGDEPARILRPGDSITIPSEMRHWHGSFPGRMFAHIAIQEAADDGSTATWHEHVTSSEYHERANLAL